MSLTTAPESLFWYWISERHNVFLQKEQGLPKPWTEDEILRTYKFTNPFRENDKGTVWLRKNFLEPHIDDPKDLIVFNVAWYRMFNWIGTGELLGWQTDWQPEQVKEKLTDALLSGQQVFTGAHIVRSAFGMPKVDSIVDVCTDFWNMRHEIVHISELHKRLEVTFHFLTGIDYVGPFMSYEIITDLRHTRVLEDATDIMTWANAGPGAIRGLQRLGLPATPPSAALESMRGLLSRSVASLPEGFPLLEMRDIEHSLCETDKFCRVKFNEGKPRGRYNGV